MTATTYGPRPLTEGEHTAVSVTTAAVAALGLLGFVISFATVARAAGPSFGTMAWMVPLGIDLGIAVFSALDIVLARLGMRVRPLRLVPWSLTGATVYLNVAGEDTVFGMVAHAMLPLLWVVAVEVGACAVRKRADLAKPDRMESIRLSRWLLALPSTFALWRRMVLWEIRSYPDALRRERDRILARTDLQDRYGRLWRIKATRRERALYRLGELVPEGIRLAPATTRPTLPTAPARRPTARTTRKGGRPRRTAPTDVDDLMPLGRQIAADHQTRGITLSRDRLRDAIRRTGQSISTDRAGALLARLRAETPTADTDADGPHGPTADPPPDEPRSDRAPSPTDTQGAAPTPPRTVAAPRNPATVKAHEVYSS
ncbi:DUF2637 domain-containing protein [Nonomuraea cavernae]|uniref:DUF2637 domain-containing protein n=1 Tax=Nonomuraea cavernae TaxID=2045107 RepID=A0A917YU63_9ACTN|nr:DUF2637 domain-containing protein [Nonomuraea cavernae]MCA2186947.1 DUF2637 domain-containing protein [Nonomuraea cavernae]GGO67100.1 hypothetical protein GCM10012289_22720 [Nonomuraea cavernae]